MIIFGNTPKDLRKKFMVYLWRSLASVFKFLELIIEVIIFILKKIKDGVYFIRDWLEEREYLS